MAEVKDKMHVAVVGAGLAGSECAWVLADKYGLHVALYEMKPKKMTPAQCMPHVFAELVCSNSLKSVSQLNPAGVLKEELLAMGSLLVPTAFAHRVPAGETLAVDREGFSGAVSFALRNHPRIDVREEVVESVEALLSVAENVVIATGPLTDDALAEDLRRLTGAESLYFYDAIAPILDGDTIDKNVAFKANRQTRTRQFEKDKGLVEEDEGDYLNLPLNRDEYNSFVQAVLEGEKVPFHNFESPQFFNGCQPIEVLAESGPRTLSFGPMKPRGLVDPRTGREPWACVQLRREQVGDGAWNMVGFQTRLTWPAQREIFRKIPGLENVEFHRMGSMHRNTYLKSPQILSEDLSLKANPRVFLAGQIMGVEGYLESISMGNYVAHVLARRRLGTPLVHPPLGCSLGSLVDWCRNGDPKHFTPMNIHWGLFPELSHDECRDWCPEAPAHAKKLDKSHKRLALARRGQKRFSEWVVQQKV